MEGGGGGGGGFGVEKNLGKKSVFEREGGGSSGIAKNF